MVPLYKAAGEINLEFSIFIKIKYFTGCEKSCTIDIFLIIFL